MYLLEKYKNLPIDIIKKILDFNGAIKYRNGVFIDQIDKKDYRYNLLLSIPKPYHYINSFFNFHYIIFFPRALYSTVKRFLHIYSNSNEEINYMLDVEDLFTVRLFIYKKTNYNIDQLEPLVFNRINY